VRWLHRSCRPLCTKCTSNVSHLTLLLFLLLPLLRLLPAFTDTLKELEAKTGYPKSYFFVAAFALAVGFLALIGGFKLIIDLVGFLYPAYMSFKSMDAGSKDDTQWLTYWIVFSFVAVVENTFGFLVNFIPFYNLLKIGAIVWMYHPTTRGAEMVYEQGLRPLLLPYLEKTSGVGKAD
jgi:receptor expression-enhancing protein 5/6